MRPNTPADNYRLFSEYFSAGTIDLLLTLYEDDAVIVPQPGMQVKGKDGIRQVLEGFLAMNGQFRMYDPAVIEAGDTALLMAKWTLTGGHGPTGEPIELSGQTSYVVKRQPDGGWLFVIDCPFGAETVGR